MTTNVFETFISSEDEMCVVGGKLSKLTGNKCLIYLSGELGAGKTTFVRGFMRGLGHEGRVKSPTYTLVEPYDIDGKSVYHFDLYRMDHPEELEMIGVSEYLSQEAVCMVEWPERGVGFLPEPDLAIKFEVQSQGRYLSVYAQTPLGQKILEHLLHD